MSLVETIKCEASKLNMTIAGIERVIGLGNGAIRRWDSNPPSVDRLSRVANFLNLSLDELYNTDTNEKKEYKKNLDINLLLPLEEKILNIFKKLDAENQAIAYGELLKLKKEQDKEQDSTSKKQISLEKAN